MKVPTKANSFVDYFGIIKLFYIITLIKNNYLVIYL